MNIRIVKKGIEDITLVKTLWEQLNQVHLEKSVHFKSKYERFTFEQRMKPLLAKAENGRLKIDMLQDEDSGRYVGYCISSIEGGQGEIESIYIESEYRKYGHGGRLMEEALNWFQEHGIENILIDVVYDNGDALPFYERYGFHISNYVLKQSPKKQY